MVELLLQKSAKIQHMLASKFDITDRKVAFVLILLVVAFVILTLTQDYVRSDLKNSAFYFSESFMFSSFWWLFAPFLFAQYLVIKHKTHKGIVFQGVALIFPVLLHLFAFPFLVWMLSAYFITILSPFSKHSDIPCLNMYSPCC